jgi:hypothetical protein
VVSETGGEAEGGETGRNRGMLRTVDSVEWQAFGAVLNRY